MKIRWDTQWYDIVLNAYIWMYYILTCLYAMSVYKGYRICTWIHIYMYIVDERYDGYMYIILCSKGMCIDEINEYTVLCCVLWYKMQIHAMHESE